MEPISLVVDLASLAGKSALITGGASGIGLAVARSWAAAGVYVTIVDIQPAALGEKLAAELHANYVYCDVTDWQSQVAAFKSAIAFSPRRVLDIVATFAGTAFAPMNQVDHVLLAGEPSLDVDPDQPNIRNIEVNLIGAYYTSWLALYYFRLPPPSPIRSTPPGERLGEKLSDKSLIYVASIGAYMDSPKASTYPASKFGVRGLFRSTRARTQDLGVRCNLLAPWFVDTPLIAPVKKAMRQRGLDMAQTLQFASINDCVEAANFCATNTDLHGRAIAIQPEGIFDLKDDLQDGWAGDQLRPIMGRRHEAGFRA